MSTLRLVGYGSPEADEPLARIRDRFADQLSQASEVATEKAIALFGEPLTPVESVRRIVDAVRTRGDEALLEFARKLDGLDFSPAELRVRDQDLVSARGRLDPRLVETLELAAANIRRFQEHIRNPEPPMLNLGDRRLGVAYTPLDSVGLYVPGGAAAYPSTVLMTAIPAAVAGVERIAMVCLPGKDGTPLPEVLAAADIAGVREIYRIGGPHAVAALAYGTETIPKVCKIVGPGNLFVTLAKREIFGAAGIESLAGPSEVVVLADEDASPVCVAADLLSQAEHDAMASAVLVTSSLSLAQAVAGEVDSQLARLPRAEIAEAAIRDYSLGVVVEDLEQGVQMVNEIAPEHLEIIARDAEALARKVTNAGAIFLGPWTPEPVGDYLAGPGHVLPTGGTARFSSGLGVNDFLKRTSLLEYSSAALKKESAHIQRFAEAEGLVAHSRAVQTRQRKAQ